MGRTRGIGGMESLLHEIPSQIVAECSTGCSNEHDREQESPLMLLDTLKTRNERTAGHVFRAITYPPSPVVRRLLAPLVLEEHSRRPGSSTIQNAH